jgi:hypothetical protein
LRGDGEGMWAVGRRARPARAAHSIRAARVSVAQRVRALDIDSDSDSEEGEEEEGE